jgi:hypothetical protein
VQVGGVEGDLGRYHHDGLFGGPFAEVEEHAGGKEGAEVDLRPGQKLSHVSYRNWLINLLHDEQLDTVAGGEEEDEDVHDRKDYRVSVIRQAAKRRGKLPYWISR